MGVGVSKVYKAHVQRVDGTVETVTPAAGQKGWVVLAEIETAIRDIAQQPSVVRVVITEERVIREYNGPAAGQKARSTTIF